MAYQIQQHMQGESISLRVYYTHPETGIQKKVLEMLLPQDEGVSPELSTWMHTLRTYLYRDHMVQVMEP